MPQSWTAGIIYSKLDEGVAPSSIRILVRTYGQTPPIEQALAAAGIPYQVLNDKPFYQRPEVQTLLDDCRVVVPGPRRHVGRRTGAVSRAMRRICCVRRGA